MKKFFKILLSRRLLLIITLIAAIVFTFVAYELSILPLKYFIPLIIIVFLITFLLYRLSRDKNDSHPVKVAVMKLINIILAIVLIIASWSLMKGSNFISAITGGSEEIIEMDVVVLKDSFYDTIDDLKGQSFGALHGDAVNINNTETMIEDDIGDITVTNYASNNELIEALMTEEMSAIIVKNVDLKTFDSIEENFNEKIRIIQKYEIKLPKVTANSAKVTQEPFIVFISGRDQKGPINTFSLSDVNMIATINPTTKQIVLVSIPRDYYVDIQGIDGVMGKDKLTHSAKGGIDATIQTVENLMDIKMNYYAKFNFTSFLNVIDALGGIEIDVPKYDVIGRDDGVFVTRLDKYTIKPGKQTFDSKHALSFVRERYAFVDGDEIRGKNQMLMLKAIIKKCCSPSLITSMDSVFESLSDSFETNLSASDIKSLINMQISDMASWDVQSFRLTGDASQRTLELATVGDVTSVNPKGVYVTQPDEQSIAKAREYIQKVMNNEIVKVESETTKQTETNTTNE